ncbi:MGMT family protein [Candidatus Stoquefichus massiliensis]|uniref:MGMT family protein n=1 Tax=Candidatus Stoquefichus massiliensis TaxID=1470350 RepID=UPI0004BCE676|nr:MGMT family protein [Candidatus Stoquefichus massiliensis]
MVVLNNDFIFQILAVVEEIPYGFVATYGQIAKLSGHDKNARLVGKVLSISEYYGRFPCHRVVNASGRCVPGWTDQQSLLENEGIIFKKEGYVDLKKHQWKIK